MNILKKVKSLFVFFHTHFFSTFYKRIKVFYANFLSFFGKIQIKFFHKGELSDNVLIKYLVKELLLYFFVAFLFFFMIFFCNQILLLAEEILKKRVPLKDVVRLIVYSLPMIIAQSSPFATLVGFLMCLGRMMSDNEILIIRASGQGYLTVAVPVIVLGLIISLFSFFVNDYLLPIGNIKYNKLYRQVASSNPGILIEPNSIKKLNNATIVIGDGSENSVSDLIIFDKGSDNRQRIIVAGKSTIVNAKKDGVLMQMNMDNAVSVFLDAKDKRKFDVLDAEKTTLNIFDSSIFSSSSSVSPREMTSFDVGKMIKNMKSRKNYSKQQLNRYRMEFHKKFSLPFASIFFAFLAIPLAFLFGKHNGQTIGLVAGLLICVWFWAMQILGQIFSSRNGMNGVFAMWLPDAIIFIVGTLLFTVLNKK